jgi:hypothetical protein
MRVEHSEPFVLCIHGFRTYRELCTVDTYLERTKHFVLWTRALRTNGVTLHCAYWSSDTTEHFVLCRRAFGTCRSLRTVYVCIRNVLNILSYVFVCPFVQNILNTYSCGYVRSQYPVIWQFVLCVHAFRAYWTSCAVNTYIYRVLNILSCARII